jgi:hypothetical protein
MIYILVETGELMVGSAGLSRSSLGMLVGKATILIDKENPLTKETQIQAKGSRENIGVRQGDSTDARPYRRMSIVWNGAIGQPLAL